LVAMDKSEATALLRELEEMLHHCHTENEIGSGIELRQSREALVSLARDIRADRFDAEPLEELRQHISSLMLHEPHRFQKTLDRLREFMTASRASEGVSSSAQP
jgi:predicted metal-dependent hydrolase